MRDLIEESPSGNFDNRVVRLKLIGFFEDYVFIDIDGGILKGPDNVSQHLDEDAFYSLKSIIGQLVQSQGRRGQVFDFGCQP